MLALLHETQPANWAGFASADCAAFDVPTCGLRRGREGVPVCMEGCRMTSVDDKHGTVGVSG